MTVPIEHVVILWDAPANEGGKIVIIDRRQDDGRYVHFNYSGGAVYPYWGKLNDKERLLVMFKKAFELMLVYKFPAEKVAEAFSLVKEFRDALDEDEWQRMV